MSSALLNVGFGVVIGLIIADYRAQRRKGVNAEPYPYENPQAWLGRIFDVNGLF